MAGWLAATNAPSTTAWSKRPSVRADKLLTARTMEQIADAIAGIQKRSGELARV